MVIFSVHSFSPSLIPGEGLYLERLPGWHLGEVPFRIRLSDGTPVGVVAYRNLSRSRRSAELGIELDPPYRGKGYGSRAIRAFLRYLFGEMDLRKVWLRVFPENEPALRCYRRCGFRAAGAGKAYLFFPCLVMILEKEEFGRGEARVGDG